MIVMIEKVQKYLKVNMLHKVLPFQAQKIKNNWECALLEVAFITGLERNAEVVHLTLYAPLMAHEEGWQWTPDMIWFNNLDVWYSQLPSSKTIRHQ